jgi:hypothetical protein
MENIIAKKINNLEIGFLFVGVITTLFIISFLATQKVHADVLNQCQITATSSNLNVDTSNLQLINTQSLESNGDAYYNYYFNSLLNKSNKINMNP